MRKKKLLKGAEWFKNQYLTAREYEWNLEGLKNDLIYSIGLSVENFWAMYGDEKVMTKREFLTACGQ